MSQEKVGITFTSLLIDLKDSSEKVYIHLGEAHKVSGIISRTGSDIIALADEAGKEKYFVPRSAIHCIEIPSKKKSRVSISD